MARSLVLSAQFETGEDVLGLTHEELKAAASLIRTGQPYPFDPKVVERVKALHDSARAIRPRRLVIDLARWLLPPVVLLAGTYWLLWRH